MTYHIDIYPLKESNLTAQLTELLKNDPQFNLSTYEQGLACLEHEKKQNIIIFEEDTYFTSIGLFEKILTCYKALNPIAIVLSTNQDIFNVVRWMRKGATDYLIIDNFNKEILINSIKGSLLYQLQKTQLSNYQNEEKIHKTQLTPVVIPAKIDWNQLKNDQYYDLAVVMIDIIMPHEAPGLYSTASIEAIFAQIREETHRLAQIFGGKLWYWSNNSNVLVFYFGDKVNCAVLTGISFFTHFFQFCIDKIKLKNIPFFKIGIHEGNAIFNQNNTDLITSEVINSLSHLTKKFVENDSLYITDAVYYQLNDRIKKSFKSKNTFDSKMIYQYTFFQYDQ